MRPHMDATVAAWQGRRQLVPSRPARYVRGMNDEYRAVPRNHLEEANEQAPWKARKLRPRKRKPGVSKPYRVLAPVLLEHLEHRRIVSMRKPPLPMYGSPLGPTDADGDESDALQTLPPQPCGGLTVVLQSGRGAADTMATNTPLEQNIAAWKRDLGLVAPNQEQEQESTQESDIRPNT